MTEHSERLQEHEKERLQYDKELGAWKRSKDIGNPPEKPERPIAGRCYCDDPTMEALAVLRRLAATAIGG